MIFNAFFTTTTLTNIIPSNLGGIVLTGISTPVDLGPLEELQLTLEISVDTGPPTIDGSILFDFEPGINDITVLVTGTRVLALPYLFQAGLQETLNWKTQVMTSNDGYEQRTKLRSSPRQGFTGNISIPRGEIIPLDILLYGWRINRFGVPVSSECRNLTSPTTGSSTIINVSTEFADFRVGGLGMIYISPRNFELFTINSLTTTQIEATAIISTVFGITALVMPMRVGRFLSSPIRSTDGDNQRLDFNFIITENATLATSPSAVQYKGLDVFLDPPLTIDNFATDQYTNRVDVADYGTGLQDTFAPWLKTKIQRQFGLQFDTLEDVWNYRLWLHRREGKLRPFWMPTFEANMILVSTGALDIQLFIEDDGQDTLSAERDDIGILTTSGWIFREISSITISAPNLEVTLTSSAGVNAEDVIMISWLGRKRLTSDNLQINWNGNDTANAVVPTTVINN
ncbi:MAG: hypothetical protein IID12_02850 [Candidatus Marinimicrobia bacterium]|nr:hypothetical protein [Candidatus Neomarinimicrobiota bacterium]